MKKVPSFILPNSISGEDNGSGNGVFSGEEPGSAKEYEPESNEIREHKFQNNFSEENLIFWRQQDTLIMNEIYNILPLWRIASA